MIYKELKLGWGYLEIPMPLGKSQLFNRHDPVTIGLIVAGSIATVSTVQQGQQAKAQGKFQEKIAQRNAQLAERQAEEQRTAAAAEAIRLERQGKALKSRQRTAIAKSGVALRGSPLSVIVDTAQNLEADRLTLLREGVIRAGTSKAQAGIFRAEGSAAKSRGRAASRASILQSVGIAAGTVGSVGIARSQGFGSPKTTGPTRASFGLGK
jgi:hypothetical protein